MKTGSGRNGSARPELDGRTGGKTSFGTEAAQNNIKLGGLMTRLPHVSKTSVVWCYRIIPPLCTADQEEPHEGGDERRKPGEWPQEAPHGVLSLKAWVGGSVGRDGRF